MEAETGTMLLAANNETILEDIIFSYETGIQGIEASFEATYRIFRDFQDSIVSTRQERGKITSRLRESLAKNESLRKKDFDRMVSVIYLYLDESEQQVRKLSQEYLGEQTKLARQLKEGLRDFKDALVKGQVPKIRDLQTLVKEILTRQNERKIEVTSKLKEFRQDQRQTTKMLKDLLAMGEDLRIRDFKVMLSEFKRQRNERITCRQRRRRAG